MKSILVVDNQGGTLYCNVNTVKKLGFRIYFSGGKSSATNLSTCSTGQKLGDWGRCSDNNRETVQ